MNTGSVLKHHHKTAYRTQASLYFISFLNYLSWSYVISAISQTGRNIPPCWFGLKSHLPFLGFGCTSLWLACCLLPYSHNIPDSKNAGSHTCTSGTHTARRLSSYSFLLGIPWTMTLSRSAVCSPTYGYDPALRVPLWFLLPFSYTIPVIFLLSPHAMPHKLFFYDI